MEYIYIRLHFMGDVIEFGKVKIKKIVLEMNPHMCLRSPCQRWSSTVLRTKENDAESSSMIEVKVENYDSWI